jgi:hypothetical protein
VYCGLLELAPLKFEGKWRKLWIEGRLEEALEEDLDLEEVPRRWGLDDLVSLLVRDL